MHLADLILHVWRYRQEQETAPPHQKPEDWECEAWEYLKIRVRQLGDFDLDAEGKANRVNAGTPVEDLQPIERLAAYSASVFSAEFMNRFCDSKTLIAPQGHGYAEWRASLSGMKMDLTAREVLAEMQERYPDAVPPKKLPVVVASKPRKKKPARSKK